MGERPRPMDHYKLSSGTTVAQYRVMVNFQQRDKIVAFLKERFTERYFAPLDQLDSPNGFFVMTICCMLVESIQAFRAGWEEPIHDSDRPYKGFFEDHPGFGIVPKDSLEFYQKIRCGILHAGETGGGWRITKTGKTVNFATKTVNAQAFKNRLRESFLSYLTKLEKRPWTGKEWNAVLNRMKGVIAVCEGGPAATSTGS